MPTEPKIDQSQLRELLIASFNDDELHTLAFDLGVDYEALPGSGKKARELIEYFQRRANLAELLAACRRLRPNFAWPSLPEKPATTTSTPAACSSARALHQLRPPVGDFVGRNDEIDRAVQSLRQSAQHGATVLIWGMGGLGKTELAYAAAEQLAADFPDAQLLLKLRGASDTSLSPARALQQIIQEFDPQLQAFDDLDHLQARYRSLLRDKRVLIVADDAADVEQVQGLMPPPGCALLITSRNRFRPPGATVIEPKTLPEAAAVELLEMICKRLGNAAARLAQLCGYLPLALRISAGLLANDVTQKVEDYLETLESERLRYLKDPDNPDDPAASVEASLNLSYSALNDVGQRTLEQISVFSASFDLPAAQQVVLLQGIKPGAGDERALPAAVDQAANDDQSKQRSRPKGRAVQSGVKDVLSMLYRRSLLEYDTTLERYNLHDLVQAFATERLSERLQVTTTQLRYVHYYLEVSQRAGNLYDKGNEDMLAGLALFDRERVHIDASWEWLQQQPDSPATDDLMIAFAEAILVIADLRYDCRCEYIPQLKAALAAAQRLKRKDVQAVFLDSLGSNYRALGETQRAIGLHEQALQICRDTGDRHGEGAVLGNLGRDYAALGDQHRAIDYYEECLTIVRKSRSKDQEGRALTHLGLAYIALGDPQRAITCFEQELSYAQAIGERDHEGTALGNIGRAYIDLGEVARAVALCERSLAIKRQLGHRWDESYALHFLGLAYAAAGELERAHEQQQEALVIAREVGDRRIGGEILNALGEIELSQDDLATAIDHLNQALAIARQIEDQQGDARASWNLGLVHEHQGDLARAAELMQVRVYYERAIGHLKAEERVTRLAQVRAQLEID